MTKEQRKTKKGEAIVLKFTVTCPILHTSCLLPMLFAWGVRKCTYVNARPYLRMYVRMYIRNYSGVVLGIYHLNPLHIEIVLVV